jgi:hypothetical protein
MAQHTATLAPVRMAGGWHVETHVGGRRVATLSEFPTEADARAWAYLLAAAPDLLAALKRIVAAWESIDQDTQVPDEINDDDAWIRAATAIARAEGR